MLNVIYIASSSRAGSTLLDFILGSEAISFSVGEMRQLQGYANRSHEMCGFVLREYPLICTCGKWLDECKIWQLIQEDCGLNFKITPFKSQGKKIWRYAIQLTYLMFGVCGVKQLSKISKRVNDEIDIAKNCWRVYDSIHKVMGSTQIIDSSKSIYHYILLRVVNPDKIRLIILYRDGRAVAKSMIRGTRSTYWKKQGHSVFLQAVRSWLNTYKIIQIFARRTPDSHKTEISYEDLCTNCEATLLKIKKQLGISIPFSARKALNRKKHHNIGGSASRFNFDSNEIRLDELWKKGITPDELTEFEKSAGKFNRSLGYE